MHDLACVVHLHSTYSDGTGTVPEIARAGGAPGRTSCCSPTTTRSRRKRNGEEGWYGDVLLLVGEEVSPRRRNHYLAFGIDEEIDHTQLDAAGICAAVRDAGGFGFAAHPFSRGSERFKRAGPGMPFDALDSDALDGIELWSFVTDTGESLRSVAEVLRFLVAPGRALDAPARAQPARLGRALPRRAAWSAIGGLDAHQFGKRIGPVVPLRLMGYHRSFRYLRTHVLCERAADRRARPRPRAGLRGAARRALLHRGRLDRPGARLSLRGGRPADGRRGARRAAHAERAHARSTRSCACCATARRSPSAPAARWSTKVEAPGVYRVEALRRSKGRERTWILSNPIYLRNGST